MIWQRFLITQTFTTLSRVTGTLEERKVCKVSINDSDVISNPTPIKFGGLKSFANYDLIILNAKYTLKGPKYGSSQMLHYDLSAR